MPSADLPTRFTARRIVVGALVSIFGLVLLVWQVKQAHPDQITAALAQIGWGFLAILAVSFVRFGFRSLAWTTLMSGQLSLKGAIAATIAGDAIGNLTPLSLLVSEPAKALYLRDEAPASRSLAALTAENFFYSLSVAMFIILGTIAMLEAFDVPPELRLAGLVSLGLMAAVVAGACWLAWREPALISGALGRMPVPMLRGLAGRVQQFETSTYAFARQSPGRLGGVLACETGFHMLSFAESYYTIWLITGRSAPLSAFVLDTFNRIVNVVFRAMPLRIGVDESSTAIVAPAVGLTSAVGVAIALVRKGRMLVWAAVGILLSIRKGIRVRDMINTRQP
jgi:hypothetical protein